MPKPTLISALKKKLRREYNLRSVNLRCSKACKPNSNSNALSILSLDDVALDYDGAIKTYTGSGTDLVIGMEGAALYMLLTDPPYGTTRNFWDVPLPLPELWEAVRWAVKPNGAILFFAQCPFDKMLGASNLAMLRYEWVWYKSRATGFLNANRAPLKKSENILVFYQKSPVYHPQFTYGEPYRKTNPRSGCSTNYGKFERTGSESSDGRRYPGNVLFVPTVTGGIHPTQKPVELCEYFIKTYTDEGEVVADICAGSGTTAVAAMNTSRRFICFENAPSIYTIAAQRIEQARLAMAGGGKGE